MSDEQRERLANLKYEYLAHIDSALTSAIKGIQAIANEFAATGDDVKLLAAGIDVIKARNNVGDVLQKAERGAA